MPEQNNIKNRLLEVGYPYDLQPKIKIQRCNICGSKKWVEISNCDRYGYEVKACACSQCGLVFLNPLMTAAAYQEFYKNTYRKLVSAYHGRLIDALTVQSEQREYAEKLANFLKDQIQKSHSKSLLDIGGSTGIISLFLKNKFNLDPLVLDPSPDEIQQAKKAGLKTHTGILEEYAPAKEKYDLIILCQTIDHLLDVNESLLKIRSLMHEYSLFFVDIVDFRAAYLQYRNLQEAIKIDHPYYFANESMTTIFKRLGFEVIKMTFAMDKLHIGYLCKIAKPDPDYLPKADALERFWREIQLVQNNNRAILNGE